uniref:Uncharacterized protein n=1 Tax=Anguilla anguilla TaxID=7936 RepID=A0A0E9QV02_ANGAN
MNELVNLYQSKSRDGEIVPGPAGDFLLCDLQSMMDRFSPASVATQRESLCHLRLPRVWWVPAELRCKPARLKPH